MADIGIFHNGGTNLPLKEAENGSIIVDASVRKLHEDLKQVTRDKVEHSVLAEEYGYDRCTFTEHHFELSGSEHSSSPIMSQMAVAQQTEEIQLCQVANILSWHDPLRLAEQTAMLDILSDGRAGIGVGRGYQPRENETLGQYWGGTIQDEEKNRTSFEEKYELLIKAWTEDLVSHHGEFHSVPPNYTLWHHEQDYGYLDDEVTEYEVEDVMDWNHDISEEELKDADNPVLDGGSKLKQLPVFPQPQQEPHPQIWEPISSPRSTKFAAKNAINGYLTTGTTSILKRITDIYYDTAEEHGWPDHRPEYDGEPFSYGWDEDRGRGLTLRRFIFNTDAGDEETLERWKLGVEERWDFFGPFGFAKAVAKDDEDPSEVSLDIETFIERDIVLIGDSEELIEQIARTKEDLDFEGYSMDISFEVPGITAEEANEQLRVFGEEVLPYVQEEL
jgi:alkanesulfonate monooxygenase SsuD/methylene tetrahydromethanopterin reductase-like flavin-dependent oxidoreductase (luciferase family)